MKLFTMFAVPVSPEYRARVARLTEQERFASMVKFIGCLLLFAADLIVIAWKGLPP